MYQVKNVESGTIIMIAPMSVIAEAFGLHKDAVRRIIHEVKRDGISVSLKRIHFEITES